MNQSNYDNYNYDNYSAKSGLLGGLKNKFRNPLFATGAILLAGAAFAGILIASYPSDNDGAQDVPIVQAEATPFKEIPSDPGGLDVPFQDSTVYSSLRNPDAPEVTSIENLLAEEEPVDRLEAFAAEAERIIKESEARRGATDTASLVEEATGVESIPEASGGDTLDAVVAKAEAAKIQFELEKETAQDIIASNDKVVAKPESAPQTLDFVRNVLDKKDSKPAPAEVVAKVEPKKDVAKEVANIKPASGFDIRPGSHYVQLGSIKAASAASSEWSKLTKKYPSELAGAKYRVERADLGERGVFFRIQAGPMAKDSASEICGSIKSQTPGGCLVTQ